MPTLRSSTTIAKMLQLEQRKDLSHWEQLEATHALNMEIMSDMEILSESARQEAEHV